MTAFQKLFEFLWAVKNPPATGLAFDYISVALIILAIAFFALYEKAGLTLWISIIAWDTLKLQPVMNNNKYMHSHTDVIIMAFKYTLQIITHVNLVLSNQLEIYRTVFTINQSSRDTMPVARIVPF
jgi:hypothetical protein